MPIPIVGRPIVAAAAFPGGGLHAELPPTTRNEIKSGQAVAPAVAPVVNAPAKRSVAVFSGKPRAVHYTMTDDIKLWLPPMLTLLGTLIVVTFTAWLNTRSVHAMIAELRRTMRADLAEVRTEVAVKYGELKLDILRIENNLDHYAETQATHSEEIRRLKGHG